MPDFYGIQTELWEYSWSIPSNQSFHSTLVRNATTGEPYHVLFVIPDDVDVPVTFMVRVEIGFGALRGETFMLIAFEPLDALPAISMDHRLVGLEDDDLIIELGVTEANTVLGVRHTLLLQPPSRGTLYQHSGEQMDAFNPWRTRSDVVEQFASRVGHFDDIFFDSSTVGDVFDDRLSFSSHYNGRDDKVEYPPWSILQLLGPPSSYEPHQPGLGYGDVKTAFSFQHVDGPYVNCSAMHPSSFVAAKLCDLAPRFEHFDVAFEEALYPMEVDIYENYHPGGVVEILALKDSIEWVSLWSGPPQLELYG